MQASTSPDAIATCGGIIRVLHQRPVQVAKDDVIELRDGVITGRLLEEMKCAAEIGDQFGKQAELAGEDQGGCAFQAAAHARLALLQHAEDIRYGEQRAMREDQLCVRPRTY